MNNEIYWLNDDSRKFLERGYLLEGESPEERMNAIAFHAAKLLGMKGFAVKFLDYLHRGFYSLSSPIWSNFGRERGLPISCFGSYISDTLSEIAGTKFAEVSMMTKHGGGTSAYFGELRGRGSEIGAGGTSTGAVHFMELYETLMNVVSQGSVRRGSFAAYLPIDHPDIEEFLKIRSEGHPIQNMSIGVTVSDEWMNSMKDGDKGKRALWGKIIKKRFESGYPYIFFSDNVNNAAPQVYKDKGLKIHASNLCLIGETTITIAKDENGKKPESLSLSQFDEMWQLGRFSQGVYVKTANFDGTVKWAKVENSACTGETDELIQIETEEGNVIECTPDHRIFTNNRGWVRAEELTEDDIIVEMK